MVSNLYPSEELMFAAGKGDIALTQSLLKQGADVTFQGREIGCHIRGEYVKTARYGPENVTALHCAASLGRRAVVRILLNNAKAQGKEIVNIKDDNGKTPLSVAKGNSIVRQLLEAGASIENEKETELHVRARKGHFGAVKEIVKFFKKKELEIFKQLIDLTPKDCAQIVVDYLGIVKALVNCRNERGHTPLAIGSLHFKISGFLLKAGGDPRTMLPEGFTILENVHSKMYPMFESAGLKLRDTPPPLPPSLPPLSCLEPERSLRRRNCCVIL